MMKTKQDNNVIDHIGEFYGKNDTELSWPIGPSAVSDKYKREQWHDRSYSTSMSKTILNFREQLY